MSLTPDVNRRKGAHIENVNNAWQILDYDNNDSIKSSNSKLSPLTSSKTICIPCNTLEDFWPKEDLRNLWGLQRFERFDRFKRTKSLTSSILLLPTFQWGRFPHMWKAPLLYEESLPRWRLRRQNRQPHWIRPESPTGVPKSAFSAWLESDSWPKRTLERSLRNLNCEEWKQLIGCKGSHVAENEKRIIVLLCALFRCKLHRPSGGIVGVDILSHWMMTSLLVLSD